MIIKQLEQKNTKVSSQTVNGFSVKCFLNQDATGGTQYGSSKIDFSKCMIKVVLNRDGMQHIIMQDNLKVIGLASNLNKRGQLAFYSNHDHYTNLNATGGQSLVSFNIELGGCIRLAGDDYLYVEVQNQDGVFATGYKASSFLEIKALKAIGYEQFIPSIHSVAIQTNESSNTYSIGDNIIRAVMLNYDQPDLQAPVIANLDFQSDRYNESLTFADLINLKEASFPKLPVNLSTEPATIFESEQSFTLIDLGQKFNQVVFAVNFNPANVNSSKNYLVYWNYKTDWTIISKANNIAKSHQVLDAKSVPASISGK